MNVREKAKHLLEANANGTPVEGGVFLAAALKQLKLDYTEESLGRIDKMLRDMREKLRPAQASFVEDPQKENFALTLAFYIGDYIARALGKPIEWLTYDEALGRIPASMAPPKAYHSRVVGLLGPVFLMPLVVLDEQLFQEKGELTARGYANDAVSLVEGQAAARGNEWHPEYLDRFLNGERIPGGVKFADTVRKMTWDFSLESLAQLDQFLLAVRDTNPNYGELITKLNGANFLWLLATYLARTSAQLASCGLKWIDYHAALQFDQTLKQKFETTYCCFMGDRLMFPILAINQILFATKPQGSCAGFADAVLSSGIPPLITLQRQMPAREQRAPTGWTLKLSSAPQMVWQEPVRHAGFLAAHGAFMLLGGLDTPPTLLQPQANGKATLVDLTFYGGWEAANARGQSALKDNPEKLTYQAYMYEGYANLPHGRFDAMVIDLRVYTRPTLTLGIAVPFTPAKSPKGFRLHSPTLLHCSAPDSLTAEIAAAFFAGIDSNKAIRWDQHSQG